jgi:hypothetical protein
MIVWNDAAKVPLLASRSHRCAEVVIVVVVGGVGGCRSQLLLLLFVIWVVSLLLILIAPRAWRGAIPNTHRCLQ